MASRTLRDLHPKLRILAASFVTKCTESNINILITCTYRSNEEQAIEYAKGRTTPGPKTTNATPGTSKHNFTLDGKPASKAFDVVPMVNGKCLWNSKAPEWQLIGKIGTDLGLEWA